MIAFGGRAQEFTVTDIQGKTHHLADYRGKWVLVNYWATWCPPCLDEIPELIRLYGTHRNKDLQVIGIAFDSGPRYKIAEFVNAHAINYPIVMGDSSVRSQIGEVEVLPVSYLYNPDGQMVHFQSGKITRSSIETYMYGK